jgi:hypothetical protein
MKRTLIALALTGLVTSVAFAEATLTGDNAYVWRNASEATAYLSGSLAKEESAQAQTNAYGQYGVYGFNP